MEHAEQTLAELLELLVTHTRPPIIVSKLEGDAVLSYLLDSGSLRGQAFAEVIESLYVDFRSALELMVLRYTGSREAARDDLGVPSRVPVGANRRRCSAH